jgi:hypothetical protein
MVGVEPNMTDNGLRNTSPMIIKRQPNIKEKKNPVDAIFRAL